MEQVAAFEAVVRAFNNPATHGEADAQLQGARDSVDSLSVAQQVLDHSTVVDARFQSILLIRDCSARFWPSIPEESRCGLAMWLLEYGAARCHDPAERPVVQQAAIAVAVLLKRGWFDAEEVNTSLLERMWQLVSAAERTQQLFGARICVALVQEFGLSATGKPTALGVTNEFHRSAATSFQQTALPAVFQLAWQLTTAGAAQAAAAGSSSGVDYELARVGLQIASEVLAWDFVNARRIEASSTTGGGGSGSGGGGGARSDGSSGPSSKRGGASSGTVLVNVTGRITPGPAFTSLLADSESSFLRAVSALYEAARTRVIEAAAGTAASTANDSEAREVCRLARAVMVQLCALGGHLFSDVPAVMTPSSAAPSSAPSSLGAGATPVHVTVATGSGGVSSLHHATAVASVLTGLLTRPFLDGVLSVVSGSAVATTSGSVDDELFAMAYAEAEDAATGLAILVRHHSLVCMTRAGLTAASGGTDVLTAVAVFTARLLQEISDAAAHVESAVASARAAGGASGAAMLADAASWVSDFLAVRYRRLCDAVDVCVDFWYAVCAELDRISDDDARSSAGLAVSASPSTMLFKGGGSLAMPAPSLSAFTSPTAAGASGSHATSFTPRSFGGHGADATVAAVLESARACINGLYSRLIDSRLDFGAALIRVGVDDDTEADTDADLAEHMESVAALGRFVPSAALALLAQYVNAVQEALAAKASGAGVAGGDDETEVDVVFERAWWLLSYAGFLIADNVEAGEPRCIPTPLNTLSRAIGRDLRTQALAAGSVNPATGMPVVPPSVIASQDPVVALITACLTLCQHEVVRVTREGAGLPAPAATPISPLLLARVAWFCARVTDTYLVPNTAEARVSNAFTTCYGIDPSSEVHAVVEAAGGVAAVVSPATGQCVIPASPQPVGGRGVLELMLRAGLSLLCARGASEPAVAAGALELLRTLCTRDAIARFTVLSPAWGELHRCVSVFAQASLMSHVAPGTATAAAAAAATATGSPVVDDETWTTSVRRGIFALGPVEQAALVARALEGCRYMGMEDAVFEDAAAAGTSMLVSQPRFAGLVARWHSSLTYIVNPLSAQLVALVTAAEFAASASDPALGREVMRLLHLHRGIVKAHDRLPPDWTATAALSAVHACHAVVVAFKATGPVCLCALEYLKDFLQEDLHELPSDASPQAYAAIGAIFQAYAAAREGFVAPTAPSSSSAPGSGSATGGGSSSASSSSSGAGATGGSSIAAAAAEEEAYEDILSLLVILERLIGQEDMALFADAGPAAPGETLSPELAICKAVTATVFQGLSFLIPLMTAGLLRYPGLASAYIRLVSELVSSHQQQVCALEPGLFDTFIASLEFGIGHHDSAIVSAALPAVQALAEAHAACRKDGFATLPGLSHHLARTPDLLSRLLSAALSLMMASSPPSRSLIQLVGSCVLAIFVADPDTFKAAVEGMIASQPSEATSTRLAEEFNRLLAGVEVDTSHQNRRNFNANNFPTFVDNVRGFTKSL